MVYSYLLVLPGRGDVRALDLGKNGFSIAFNASCVARYGRVRAQKEAPRASLSHKAMAKPPVAGPWTHCFFAADRDRPFSGSRPGYVFKLGTRGLGYYPDYRAPENWAAWERSFSVRDRTRRAWKQRRAAELQYLPKLP